MGHLASVLLLGIGAQWLAWRLRLPSILLLLLVGFVAGPFTGLIAPDAMLGGSLLPFVSLSVALILLEGGLSLRLSELRGAGRAVSHVLVFGPPVTLALTTLAAHATLDVQWGTAFLLGSVLVVTGPTVIVPLLRHVRPSGSVGSVVRWEGIVTDPIGAILAVLIFQVMVQVDETAPLFSVARGLVESLVIGGVAGAAVAFLLLFLLHRHLVPDFLHTSVTLALGLGCYVAADTVRHESGLLAVTWMGILLANQERVAVEHIVEFKENLRTLLISSLFILLAARVPLEDFESFDWRSLAFVGLLILVVRPAAVFTSLIGTGLTTAEKVFVSWMAPRGIVAAAIASVFALELGQVGHPDAGRIVPVVFAVIVLTVSIYGLTAGPLARRLGLAGGDKQGVLLFGSHVWSRALGRALREAKVDVLLVDTNYGEIRAARMAGLDTYHGNILTDDFEEHVALDDLGYLLAVTRNTDVNALACLHFAPWFGRANVYLLAASEEDAGGVPMHLRGRILASEDVDFWDIDSRIRAGAVFKRTRLSEEYGYDRFLEAYDRPDAPVIPLFIIDEKGRLQVASADRPLSPGTDDTVLALVGPESDAAGQQDSSGERVAATRR